MRPFIVLNNFEIVLPSLMMTQTDALAHIAEAHSQALTSVQQNDESIRTLVRRYGVKSSQIAFRAFENIHFVNQESDIYDRTRFFGKRALEIFASFYPKLETPPDHLIHVTCTGYLSPSPAQHLVNDNGWSEKTNVTHAYHMGCYAALPAVRMAEGFVATENPRVDIVHTEMCGLHMDSHQHAPEQIVVQSLFADGHVKYSAVADHPSVSGFRVLKIREQIIKDSQEDMSWIPAKFGMKMTLSREVPEKIAENLRLFLQKLLEGTGHELSKVVREAIFAVHPGGPKIIDAVEKILELKADQVKTSREILLHRGNMSSATLPHVWQKLLEENIPTKKLVVSLAFGPGLTIFGALFEVV